MDRDYRIYSRYPMAKVPKNEEMRAILERCEGSSSAVEIHSLKQPDYVPILVDVDVLRGRLFG